jgi:hypothetical protein
MYSHGGLVLSAHRPIGDPTTGTSPEPTSTEPDRLLLRAFDGSDIEVESPRRLGDLVRVGTRLFSLRAVDSVGGRWLRIYREVVPDEIRFGGDS